MSIPHAYHMREYQPPDAERIAALFNLVEQDPETGESVRTRFASTATTHRRWVVEDSTGTVVGYGGAVALTEKPDSPFAIRVFVDPDHEGMGIGRTLHEVCERLAWECEAGWAMSKVRDDMARELRFAQNAGYVEAQHLYGVVCELDTLDRTPAFQSTDGLRIVSFSELGDNEANRRALYELYRETDADTPGIEMWGQEGFDEWSRFFESTWFRAEGCLLALEGERWIGVSMLGPKTPDDYVTDFTGVRSSYRGRGVATALKWAGLQWALAEGAKRVHTYNDDRNAAMRAINAKLGFQPRTGWRSMRKLLS